MSTDAPLQLELVLDKAARMRRAAGAGAPLYRISAKDYANLMLA